MELPPGFRFHPTDEELITHYLSKKIVDCNFSAVAIGEVDMNKVEPWDLPWTAKTGEKEWYFFCVKDKKYPTGSRANRATAAGYWKATGRDKEVFRGKALVGMKKTLVFYKGRAPNGEKSNWVAHEYNMPNYPTKNNWVISRVFQKTSGGKKVHISEIIRNKMYPPTPPPLMDPNVIYYNTKTEPMDSECGHVHCFSNPNIPSSCSWGPFVPVQDPSGGMGSQIPGFTTLLEDSSVFRDLVGRNMNNECKKEGEMASVSQVTAFSTDSSNLDMEKMSFDAQGLALASVGSLNLDTIWSY